MSDSSLDGLSQTEPRLSDDADQEQTFPGRTEPLQKLDELASLLDEAEAKAEVAVTQELAPPSDATSGDAKSTEAPSGNDGEVVEYMASLMERYGIKGSEPAVTATVAPQPTPSSPNISHVVEAEVVGDDDADSEKVVPRRPTVAPERDMDMGSLREIANQTARSAVNTHLGGQIVSAAYTKLILAFVAILSSAICGAASPTASSTFYYVAIGAAVAAFFWVGQFWRLSSELNQFMANQRSPSDK